MYITGLGDMVECRRPFWRIAMAMQKWPERQDHYGRAVWVNPTTESLREQECLCFNCDRMKPGQDDHCLIATAFYGICRLTGTAFAMTRCPDFKLKRQ
jgi:hypothetical protein